MRFTSHILAFVLAITSIAVPCLAEVQAISVGEPVDLHVTVKPANDCGGPCIKAIVSRESDLDRQGLVPSSGPDFLDLIAQPSQKISFPRAKTVGVFGSPQTSCESSVDLFVLCRLLN